MKNVYKKRIADEVLKIKLKSKGAVLIQGPKWCGKTTTAEQVSKSKLYMANPQDFKTNLNLASINPLQLLKGDVPRLLDEWQVSPKLWDAVRFEVDHRNSEGQFILTGSASPLETDQIIHTGTGRFAWMTMRPMSLYESEESNGSVSLENLFTSPVAIEGTNELTFEQLAFLCCRGGWPRSISMEKDIALLQASDYYDSVVRLDVTSIENISRNEQRLRRLMRSYARNIGTQASYETLKNDLANNETMSFDTDTIASYVNLLKSIFVIEESLAWNPNLRSKTAIRTTDTRYFIDPSIATSSLEIYPDDLINDLNTFGFIFETLCIRDLRVYADSLNGIVYHYRDSSGLECDAVIHLKNGSYGLVEIKLGGDNLIEEGAYNLKKLKSKIDDTKMKNPSFLMVLVGVGKFAYKREDGVYIVPIGCLKN